MSQAIKVLLVEDSEDDAQLLLRQLRQGGYEPHHLRVETPAAFGAALAGQAWDLVISDYSLPHFNGLAALQLFQERGLDLPFIVVSGQIGEETAVAVMKAGANDYIMKNNLARLIPAIEREIKEAAGRRERCQAEEAFKNLIFQAPIGIYIAQKGKFKLVNPGFVKISGYQAEELLEKDPLRLVASPYQEYFRTQAIKMLKGEDTRPYEFQLITRQGETRWIMETVISTRFAGENAVLGYFVDITERKLGEEKLRNLNTLLKAIKDINEVLLRAKTEPELLGQICELTTQIPYIRSTCVGLVEADSFKVKPVAWAGMDEGFLAALRVTWDDSEYGRGPTGTAIRTGQPVYVEDIETSNEYIPWRQEALQRGCASSLVLPLVQDEITLGNCAVFLDKKGGLGEEEVAYLKRVAGDIAVGLRSLRLAQRLEQSIEHLQMVFQQTVEALSAIVEMRDPYTAGHQQKVTHLALALATELGLSGDRRAGLRIAGLLHDIGKMLVPPEILAKPGKLSEVQFNFIKQHPQSGYDILRKIEFPWPLAQIVMQHHERLDGSGYPAGLKGDAIMLEARILAVADVVEAMASHRPYRPALGIEKSLEEITKNKGVLYDPEVVDACVKLFTEENYSFD